MGRLDHEVYKEPCPRGPILHGIRTTSLVSPDGISKSTKARLSRRRDCTQERYSH